MSAPSPPSLLQIPSAASSSTTYYPSQQQQQQDTTPSAPPMQQQQPPYRNDGQVNRTEEEAEMDPEDDEYRDESDGKLYRASVVKEPRESLFWGKLIVGIVIFLHLGFLIYYFGWVFSMIKFQDEYTGWVNVPAPGTYIQRAWIDWQWYFVAVLVLNVFPPILALLVLNNVYMRVRADLSRVVSLAVLAITGIALCGLVVMWMLANTGFMPFNIAHSDLYCCRNYGSVAASGRCRNVGDCLDAPSATVQLGLNGPFIHLLVGPLFLMLFCALEYGIVDAVRTYARALKNSQQVDLWHSRYLRAAKRVPTFARLLLTGVILAYIGLVICYILLGPLALDIRHTHQFPAVGPVGTQSARDSFAIIGIVVSMSALLIPALAMLSVHFTGATRYSVIILLLLFVLAALHMFSFMGTLYTRSSANTPGQPNNIANSEIYCCAPDVRANPASQCDNLGPCVLPLSGHPDVTALPTTSRDLQPNKVHTIMFAMMGGFVLLDIATITLVLVTSLWPLVSRSVTLRRTVDNIASYISSPIGLPISSSSPLPAPIPSSSRPSKSTGGDRKATVTVPMPRFSSTGTSLSSRKDE